MWTLLLLLWIVPIATGVLLSSRILSGRSALSKSERALLLDERKKTQMGGGLALKFALLAAAFFAAGLVQGIVLPNLSTFWFVAIPLLTGAAAILLLVIWLRAAPASRGVQARRSRGHNRASRIDDMLFR